MYQPHRTLHHELVHVNDNLPSERVSEVVYSIPCKDCSKVYIGQTSRLLGAQLTERKAAVKHATSAVAKHVWK